MPPVRTTQGRLEHDLDDRTLWPRPGVQWQHQLGDRQWFGVAESSQSTDTGSVGVADGEQRLATIILKELDAIYELYASSGSGPDGGVNISGYQEVFSGTRCRRGPGRTWLRHGMGRPCAYM